MDMRSRVFAARSRANSVLTPVRFARLVNALRTRKREVAAGKPPAAPGLSLDLTGTNPGNPTTIGFGDIVPKRMISKAILIAFIPICVSTVAIALGNVLAMRDELD